MIDTFLIFLWSLVNIHKRCDFRHRRHIKVKGVFSIIYTPTVSIVHFIISISSVPNNDEQQPFTTNRDNLEWQLNFYYIFRFLHLFPGWLLIGYWFLRLICLESRLTLSNRAGTLDTTICFCIVWSFFFFSFFQGKWNSKWKRGYH